ncbi:predicted protein [Streptomyces pristinaespiralis ATCC 25486]|uniref:Predicted protein n=1 Tax=Streptomyces pristinaespiralis (strain ATCC 25486 / DSM 40338 / CBS 914.69 / JCM 4507 / KCC S-0507 / NBRC 13074 / NRRL 2958 / 5647) TaxID=457429 RepID=B5HF11_STRE2|nr:predicted protein [Streptomyces pristinaespiralis ATCC 25486]
MTTAPGGHLPAATVRPAGRLAEGHAVGVRGERSQPGAQLRITDANGMRITCFAPPDRPIADLELRHRLRARAEDRIRAARATGLRSRLLCAPGTG